MRALLWQTEGKGDKYDIVAIPDDHLEAAREWRDRLIETISENDEEMMELYLEGTEPDEEQLIAAIRRATIAGGVTPVLCGSAFKNKGVQPMLDAIVDFLPSPVDIPAIKGHKVGDEEAVIERHADPAEPFAALAFKIMSDQHLGKLTYIRIYSGTLEAGKQVLNSTKGRRERIGKIYQMHANKREERPSAIAGQIVAVMGLKDTTTGDTLSDQSNQVILESMTFPAPVINVAIEPRTKARPGQAGHRHPAAGRGGPDLPGPDRRGDRPDDHLRDGRAPPGGPGRADEARVPGGGQHRPPAGRLPRDRPPEGGEGRVHAQEADRWLRPVRPGGHQPGADRRRRRRLRVREQDHTVGASRASTSRRWTPAARRRRSSACWPGTRWST